MCIMYIYLVSGLCEVETGQSNIILDIEESRGSRKSDFKMAIRCGKVNLTLYLNTTPWGNRVIAPYMLNFGTRWR